jgi:tRNA pseudouridine38-40 synthase
LNIRVVNTADPATRVKELRETMTAMEDQPAVGSVAAPTASEPTSLPEASTASSEAVHSVAPEGYVRLRLLVSYLGTNFHGLAPQPRLRTVVGNLGDALKRILRLETFPMFGMSGRTDTGVHGWGQVLHLDVPNTFDPSRDRPTDIAKVQRSLNSMLGPEIVVRELTIADPAFHARYDATFRAYRYTVLNRVLPDPFLSGTSWHVPDQLNVRAMQLACDPFLGEHDFTSFCRIPKLVEGMKYPSMVRLVTHAEWHELGDGLLRFDIQATSFCQQMVRAIVGFMIEIGRGQRTAGDVLTILHARDRSEAAPLAPPHGLCLWHVGYPDE